MTERPTFLHLIHASINYTYSCRLNNVLLFNQSVKWSVAPSSCCIGTLKQISVDTISCCNISVGRIFCGFLAFILMWTCFFQFQQDMQSAGVQMVNFFNLDGDFWFILVDVSKAKFMSVPACYTEKLSCHRVQRVQVLTCGFRSINTFPMPCLFFAGFLNLHTHSRLQWKYSWLIKWSTDLQKGLTD